MWYVVQTTNGQENTAIEKCRQEIPVEVADKIFSPSYEGMHKYQGEWHIEINKLFPGYVFIQSENADQLETYLEHLSGTVTPVQIGGGFYPIRTEEQAYLMEMLDTDDCVRYSLDYIVDGKLVVERGPLSGKTDHVRKIDRHKRIANLTIRLFGQDRQIRVGLEIPARLTVAEYQQQKAAT